jgi:hypothetical protein
MIAPALLALNSDKMESKKAIAVLDETGWFDQKFDNTETNTFVYHDENENIDSLKKLVFMSFHNVIYFLFPSIDTQAKP